MKWPRNVNMEDQFQHTYVKVPFCFTHFTNGWCEENSNVASPQKAQASDIEHIYLKNECTTPCAPSTLQASMKT